MAEILGFTRKTYTARQFLAPVGDGHIKLSGTLDGFIDFAVPGGGTYRLTLDEARLLIAGLQGVIRDVSEHCLYDQDALLAPSSSEI